jgi:hypothetical protein
MKATTYTVLITVRHADLASSPDTQQVRAAIQRVLEETVGDVASADVDVFGGDWVESTERRSPRPVQDARREHRLIRINPSI